ncbi:MAG: hypothetical protein MZV49_25865 [Rhodopseudomonas palustris]|nr:hypothetical protein [Rhodopseudomonas palustris]
MQKSVLHKVVAQLRLEWHELITIHPSDRPWQMALAAALATGLPLMVGAWFDHLDYGLISSLGGLSFLYLPATPLHHRMVLDDGAELRHDRLLRLRRDQPFLPGTAGAGADAGGNTGDHAVPVLSRRRAGQHVLRDGSLDRRPTRRPR